MQDELPVSGSGRQNNYVACVTGYIVDALSPEQRGGNDWEVTVFDNEQANAFALPGGKMGVFTGLLDVATNQHQRRDRHLRVEQQAVGLQQARQVLAWLECPHAEQEVRFQAIPHSDLPGFRFWQWAESRIGGQMHDRDLLRWHIQQQGQVGLGSVGISQDVVGATYRPLDLLVV